MLPSHRFHDILLSVLLVAAVSAPAQTDLGPLFAEPSPAEIATVQADWTSRPTEASGFALETNAVVDGYAVSRASFVHDGLTQYGLVRFPRDHTPGGSYPVMVMHHGGIEGFFYLSYISFDEGFPSGCVGDSAFVLVPTYRGEGFAGGDVLGNRFSEGEVSLWDRDCDDAMAMLTAFLDATPEADPERITSLGRSRGAGVAYHMALRDGRVRRSVIMFGASDFRQPDIQADCDAEVNHGFPATNTLSRKVMDDIVSPWLAGEMTLAEARLLLIGWSSYYHLEEPLSLQVHHGEQDENIPIAHAELVDSVLTGLGAGPPEYDFYRYPLAGHGVSGMTDYEERVEDYLCHLPPEPTTDVPSAVTGYSLEVWPNPFAAEVTLQWEKAAADTGAEAGTVRILDLRGRVVRRLAPEDPQGLYHWDGRDSRGREAPAGLYFAVGGAEKSPDRKAGALVSKVRGRLLKLR